MSKGLDIWAKKTSGHDPNVLTSHDHKGNVVTKRVPLREQIAADKR